MPVNPYETPGLEASRAEVDHVVATDALRRRPFGVAVLAALHVLGAVVVIGAVVMVAAAYQQSGATLGWLWVIAAPIVCVLAVVLPVGLWTGKRWGWWLAAVYYAQFALGAAVVLLILGVTVADDRGEVTQRQIELAGKHVARLAIFAALLWYMTNRDVLDYFRLQRMTRLGALARALGAAVALLLALALVVFLTIVLVYLPKVSGLPSVRPTQHV